MQVQEERQMNRRIGRRHATAMSLWIAPLCVPVVHAAEIDPQADRILKPMKVVL